MKKRVVLIIPAVLLLLGLVMLIANILFTKPASDTITVYSDGWNVKIDESEYYNLTELEYVDVLEHSFGANDKLIMSHELNADLTAFSFPTLLLEINRCNCRIYINDDLLYDTFLVPALPFTIILLCS